MTTKPDETPRVTADAPGRPRDLVLNAQVLRFFAALIVLIGHAQHEAIDIGTGLRAEWFPIPWPFGVDIFFVISGFVMYLTSSESFGTPGAAGAFFRRRLIRIVPSYWIFTALALAAAALFGSVMRTSDWSAADIAASFAFIPWRQENGLVMPILSLGWTLNYEMFFYVVFAFCLMLPRRVGMTVLFGLFLSLAALHPLVPAQWAAVAFWTDPIIIEFLFGILLAIAYRRGVRIGTIVAIVLFVGGLAAASIGLQGVEARWIGWGIPAAMIGAAAFLSPSPSQNRLVTALTMAGGASYALYLSHPFTVNLVLLVGRQLGGDRWPLILVASAVIAAILVSLLYYVVVEQPLTAVAKRLFRTADRG